MKTRTRTTAIIVGATAAALLSVGAVTYAASGGNGPWRHLTGGGMNGQEMRDGNGMHGDGKGNGMSGDMADRMNGNGMGRNGMSGDMSSHMNGQGMDGQGMHGEGWTVPAATGGTADATERDALLRMVEEEKLAHDVYVTLGDKWDVTMFDHIASSETRHEAAVQTLLDRYGITDPTVGNGVGEFTDPAFDSLYTELVADGSVSQDAAFQVGQQVEQLDIDDLEARIATTDNADITAVYEHLLAGSQHHLQAFTMMLDQ